MASATRSAVVAFPCSAASSARTRSTLRRVSSSTERGPEALPESRVGWARKSGLVAMYSLLRYLRLVLAFEAEPAHLPRA